MARKVFISFLGTNDYLECHYELNGTKSVATRFVQEALIDALCREWSENDEIIIFGTSFNKELNLNGSKEKNWLDCGQERKGGEPRSNGLQKILQSKNLKAKVNELTIIPEGFSEKEIWDIFTIVFDKLNPNDEIYFDVTHAFRSIPMFSTILLNYAKLLRKTKLISILYGAFEKLGPAYKVSEKSVEERIAPVLNLMPLVDLLDWTQAASNFLDYGKTDKIHKLLKNRYIQLNKESLGKNQDAKNIQDLDKKLIFHSESIISNKLDEIIKGSDIQLALETVKKSENVIAPAFKPLLEKIEEKLYSFFQNDLNNVFAATEWCIRHELYQNAYSILLEGTISIILHNISEDNGQITEIEDKRNIITYVVNCKSQKKTKEQCLEDNRYPEQSNVIEKAWIYIDDNLKSIISSLNAKRNSYMHGGTGTNTLGNFCKLKSDIQIFNEELKNKFNQINQSSDSDS